MRKRIIIFLFSIICITELFAQSNNGTNISGDDVGWGDGYDLIYRIDGVLYKTITLEEGAPITPEPAPSKEGYTFSGWSEIPSTMPANDVEVTGTFSINSYNLVYLVDGKEYKSQTVEYGSKITPESSPTKEGYTFSGWSEIPSTMPANDVEITGSFSINSYKLVYLVDGKEYKSQTVEYGSKITPEASPTKEGYTFSGWSEISSTMPANDVEVTGTFSINSYKLVYLVDGKEYKSQTVEYGSKITPEESPTKEGYTFSGWSEVPATMPANDFEVTGTFSINSYKLVYMVDGKEYKSITVEYGSKITPESAPTKEGFTFSGWSGLPETMPANDVTVNGSFGENTYNLTYKVDGEVYRNLAVVFGSAITAEPAPTKEGYTFSGWSEIPSTMPANDLEVTGTFIINSYKLVYLVDGKEYKSQTLEYGSKITPEESPIKEGYTFSGWSEIPATMPANDVEVTGTFSVNSYKMVYMVDGSEYKSLTLGYGSTITPETDPTKEGYTFSGWSEIPSIMPANDVEITGSFTVNKYILEVLVDDEVIYSDSIAFGTRLIDYLDLITQNGIDLTQWEWYSQIDTITMPGHDVIIHAVRDAVLPTFMDEDNSAIFDLTGRQIQADNISTLPSGIYFHKGRKFIVR